MSREHQPVVVPAGGRRWTFHDTLRVTVAVGALVVGALLARTGVPGWEKDTFEVVNHLPGALYPFVWPVMQLGSFPGAVVAALVLAVAIRRRSVAVCTVGAVLAAWLIAKVVKDVVGRERPFGVGLEVEVRDHATTGLGYASGHSALAFTLYAMAAPHLGPRMRHVALGLALLVAFARVYSGAHLPLDVVGGAALGTLVGEAFRAVEVAWRSRSTPPAPVGMAEPA